jgi:hypothetical protein
MEHRNVYEELINLMKYNPPPVHIAEASDLTFCYPNMFFERHLDSRLGLKHIKLASSLTRDIAKLVYDELKLLKAKGQPLPPARSNSEDGCCFRTTDNRENYPPRTERSDAESIADFYKDVSYYNCASIASTITLHPQAKTWLSVLSFYEGWEDKSPPMIDDRALRIRYYRKTGEVNVFNSIWSCLDEELRDDIRGISSRFGPLAAFQFSSPFPEVEDIFRNMARKSRVPSLSSPVVDCVVQDDVPLLSSPDSIALLELLPSLAKVCATTEALRRSPRIISPSERPPRKAASISGGRRALAKPWSTITVKRPAARADPIVFVQRVRIHQHN